jgi:hypothetical protein
MGIFNKPKVAEASTATADTFVLAETLADLQKQRADLESAMQKTTDTCDHAIYRSRLDGVNEKIRRSRGNGTFAPALVSNAGPTTKAPKPPKKNRTDYPWEWPGPIAPAGMKAIKQEGNTYSHVTNTDPEHQGEDADEHDYKKVVAWAERMGWSGPTVHWGTLVSRGQGPLYTKTMLMLLQERIRAICADRFKNGHPLAELEIDIKLKEKPKKMGIFDKKKTTEMVSTAADLPVSKESTIVAQVTVSAWAEQERKDAIDRLVSSGVTIYKVVENQDQANEILKHRSLAILALGLVMEQYEKEKTALEQQIKDISLVFDPALEVFMKQHNKTGKKTWSLLYGDLKVANKPESVKLDEEHDMDGSLFQAWLKTQYEKKTEVVAAADIVELKKYGRDMKKFADWYKAQPKKPSVPGISYSPAKQDVFSISPSLDTAKKHIKDELKGKVN